MPDENDPTTIVIFSYMPLLLTKITEHGLRHIEDPEKIKEVSKQLGDPTELAGATGCLWVEHQKVPTPILVLERAEEIYNDLMTWCEREPHKWFALAVAIDGDRYSLSLFPNLNRSIKRHRIAMLQQTETIITNPKYQIITVPLHFVSGPGPTVFTKLKQRLPKSSSVFLYDVADLDRENPQDLDHDKLYELEDITLSDSESALQHAASLLAD